MRSGAAFLRWRNRSCRCTPSRNVQIYGSVIDSVGRLSNKQGVKSVRLIADLMESRLSDDLPVRLQAYFHAKALHERTAFELPPSTAYLHEADPAPDASFALPAEPPGEDLRGALDALTALFAAHERTLRIQFVDAFAPDLGTRLAAAGLHLRAQAPLMTCTPATLHAAPALPGLESVIISSESPLEIVREGWNANALGYDLNAELATDAQVEEWRATLVTARGFTARLEGQAVAAGMFEAVRAGLTELAGITTLVPYRGRGIAAWLTAQITATAFARGVEVAFLVPENDTAQRVYARIGYSIYTHLLTWG